MHGLAERQTHNATEWIIALQGHPRSSILYMVSSNLDPSYLAPFQQWRREGICRPGQTSVLPPPPTHTPSDPVAYLEIWIGTFQVYIFRSFQILAYFFHSKYQYSFFHTQRCPGVGVSRSIRPWSLQSDRQLIFLWLQEAMMWTVNSSLSWGVYNCLTQWNLGLGRLTNFNCQKNWESAYT